jgi:membrane associated rhomboid family serine protease
VPGMNMPDDPRPRGDLFPGLGPPGHPKSEPIFNLPAIVVIVIGALVAVHLWRLVLSFERDLAVLAEFAVVPARFALDFGWMDQARIMQDTLAGLSGREASERMAVARYFVDGGGPRWWSLLTYGLLHSGTAHIVMNTIWLAVFGSPLARRLGPGGFLAIIGLGTIAGALAHIVMHAGDVVPLVGASAGVSAATGAAARFVFSGGIRFGAMADDQYVRSLPALPLGGLFQNRQAVVFVGLWFVSNWLFGSGVVAFGNDDASIAWEAHVGGFLAGLLLFPLLDRLASAPAETDTQ